jgi:uncharacterized membrane protein YphA (DoxX/SURF4 family)
VFEAFFKEKLAPLTLRLGLGALCVWHGFTKIMVMGGLNWNPALPVGWQLLIAWSEFGAGLAILLGFYCRLAATMILALLAGTLIWWQGWSLLQMPLRSLESTLLLLIAGLTLLFLGAGELSLDNHGAGSNTAASKSVKRRAAA